MGACDDYRIYKGDYAEATVRTLFATDQEDDRYENGHSYSGTIGMANGITFPKHEPFPDLDAAYEWVFDNAKKWGPALAVRFQTPEGINWFVGAVCSS